MILRLNTKLSEKQEKRLKQLKAILNTDNNSTVIKTLLDNAVL